ncbi:phosphate ABC transporter substrate-binding protein [Thalassotalea ganghwensis]
MLIKKLILVMLLGIVSTVAKANIAVIVNPAFSEAIDQSYIKRIFLGKEQLLPSGNKVSVLEIDNEEPLYATFCELVVDKRPDRYKAYMAKKIFTGKAAPLKRVGSTKEMKEIVASSTDFIGYIPASEVDDTVKVLHTF